MHSTKFEYTVSGVKLTEAQQNAIRDAMAEAVSAALLDKMKDLRAVGKKFSKINLPNGGDITISDHVPQITQPSAGSPQHPAGG